MTQLMVPVTKKNRGFIIYNHLYSREGTFTLRKLKAEILNLYGLEIKLAELKYIIKDYIESGFVMYHFNEYIVTADKEG